MNKNCHNCYHAYYAYCPGKDCNEKILKDFVYKFGKVIKCNGWESYKIQPKVSKKKETEFSPGMPT